MPSSATPRKKGFVKNRKNSADTQRFVTRIDIVAFLEWNVCHCNRNRFRKRRKAAGAAICVCTWSLLFTLGLSLITISSVITQWYHSFVGFEPTFLRSELFTPCIFILCFAFVLCYCMKLILKEKQQIINENQKKIIDKR